MVGEDDANLQARLGRIEKDIHDLRDEFRQDFKDLDSRVTGVDDRVAGIDKSLSNYRGMVGGILLVITAVITAFKLSWEWIQSHWQ